MMRAMFFVAVLCGVRIGGSHGKDCGFGFKCGDDQTCCLLSHISYGCCPYKNAVCCKDMRHCCPSGYTCDLADSRCIPSFINIITSNDDDNNTEQLLYVNLLDADIIENNDKKTKLGVELRGGDNDDSTILPEMLLFWGWMGISFELLILILAASAALGLAAFLVITFINKLKIVGQYQNI